jgi:hypothetical protein
MAKRPVAYSQNDSRWAGLEYAGGSTFSQNGCLACSVPMVLSLYYDPAPTPPEVAAALRSVEAFNGNLLSSPSRIPKAYPLVEWGGAIHWRTCPADLAFLAREIELYGAVIIELKWNPRGPLPQRGNQHFAVLVEVGGDDATVIDPWDGETKKLSESRYCLAGWSPARTIYGARLLHGVETK